MKVSELTTALVAEYVNVSASDALIEMMIESAIDYACNYTGLEESALDDYEDITMAVLMKASDFYDIRTGRSEKPLYDGPIDEILNSHRRNFLPEDDEDESDEESEDSEDEETTT